MGGDDNKTREVNHQKSYFDVLGLCCSSEVPLIEKILKPLEGIEKVSVLVPSKTVIVVHDTLLISQLQIVKALNQARLEATIRVHGSEKIANRWPSPYILACGLLLLVSLFKHFYHPLRWFALAGVVVGLPPIILRSIAAVRRFTLDINILMLIAVGGSIALRDYSEAGFIVFLFTIAEWLESRASHKATAGMSALMSMAPQKAVIAETGQVVDAKDVKVETILAVKAGEVIPIDGVVVEGKSEVDEKSLTGESIPLAKQAQSLVWAGTLNINGYISVKTTALAENSAVAKMAKLVEEAQNSKSQTQRLIDSCAKYYTPAVVLIAAGIVAVPSILRVHNLRHWFQLALVLIVSACPCALVLSTPVATFCALLNAARTGLLIKGGDVLEALAKTRVVAFDKTGTITKGEFTVMEFRPINTGDVSLETLLYWVSSIESKSSHPMASALVDYALSNSIEPKPENVSEFHIYPGEGIHGEIDGEDIYIGNKRMAMRAGCDTVPSMEDIKGVTIGYVISGAVPVGLFTLSDTCRTGVPEAIAELKRLGLKIAMLTGDSSAAATHVQDQLGNAIEILHAELLPEDKVRFITDLKTKEGSTVMVGDGMNDAPALATADVGISMGISGSAVAMETSHITLMSNDVRKIPEAIRLAKRTQNKIIENILFSLTTKIAILALAFAGHPFLWAAVLADVGTCLVVIFNSMLLLQTRSQKGKKCCSSSHKSHLQRPKCSSDHHARSSCGSGGTCLQKHGPHEHKHGSHEHKHGSHEHKQKEEGRANANCSSSCKKQDCHMDSPNCSHHCLDSATHETSASHEHLISITSRAEHHSDSSHEEHLGSHSACSHKHDGCGNQPPGNDDTESTPSHACRGIDKREISGCCRSFRSECGKKDSCCGGSTEQLHEIITV